MHEGRTSGAIHPGFSEAFDVFQKHFYRKNIVWMANWKHVKTHIAEFNLDVICSKTLPSWQLWSLRINKKADAV